MLKKFEVTGFKNFKNTFSLDFSDVRNYNFNTSCITDKTISKMIIYGQNAVGKSNFGLALFDIVSHLTPQHVTPGLYDYYLNSSGLVDYAEFLYVFQFGSHVVEYRYRKLDNQTLLYEKLLLDDALLYEYDYQKRMGCKKGIEKLAPTLNWSFQDTECIFKYFITNSVLPEDHPLRCVFRYVNNMLWFRNLDENRYIGYKSKSNGYYDFIFDDTLLEEFTELLHTAGIQENLTVLDNPDGKRVLYYKTDTPLPFFKVSSNGTKALYTLFYWYKTAKDVSLLFIDEFDAFYHYELSETVVSLLKKMTGTQVILTSHNTNLLSNRIMRPDCYFILTKEKLTSFANATPRDLREGHNLKKLYMSGEFNG